MLHGISIMIVGLCLFALAAMLLPDDFGMPVDDRRAVSALSR